MTVPSLDNHSSAVGSSVSLSVTAGDSLIFILDDVTTGQYFSSVDYFGVASPAKYNVEGYNHAYSTPTPAASAESPQGTYIGMEEPWGHRPQTTLWLRPSTTTTTTSSSPTSPQAATPEPSTFILFGTGLVGTAGALRASLPAANPLQHQRPAMPENTNLPGHVLR